MGWICRESRWMTGEWYTSGSAREGARGSGGGDGSDVGVAGAFGAGGGAGVDAERRRYTCTGSAYRCGAERRRYTCTGRTYRAGAGKGTGAVRGAAGDTGSARGTTGGPGAARQQAPGPRLAQQGSPEAVPVYRENLQGKGRQVTVAEPPGQSKTVNPTLGQEKVWKRWSRGNPTRQRRRVGRSERGER